MPVAVELFDDLDAVERDAAGALDREAQPRLFDRLSWLRLIWTHCPPPGRLLVARARDGTAGAACWLFLAVEDGRAEPLASWYSLRTGPIHHPAGAGGRQACVAALARTLRKCGIGRITLAPLAGDAADVAAAFRQAGWLTVLEPAGACWRTATRGMTFASYWAERPSRLRHTAERKARAAALDLAIHDRFDEAAWVDYETVYAASWKPAEGSMPFLRALAEQEGAAGTLRLGIARKDGQPIAAQLWLVEDGIATIHKLAHAEAAKVLSPGTLLGMEMFRYALDVDHVRAIDFGLGDEPYKADWMMEKGTVWRLAAFDPLSLQGLAGYARARASSLVRRGRND